MESDIKGVQYAELHCISNYTFLRGASHPAELIVQAANLGYQALAITDECSVAGVVRAYEALESYKKQNDKKQSDNKQQPQSPIKLIVGAEFSFEVESSFKVESTLEVESIGEETQKQRTQKIVLLCPNLLAYQELCQLITLTRRRTKKGSYQLFKEDLTPLKHGFLLWYPSKNNLNQNKNFATWYKKHSRLDSWVGIERLLANNETQYLAHCQQLAAQFNWPVVASSNVHMHSIKRQPLQDVLTAINHGTTVNQAGSQLFSNAERYLRSLDKLAKLYSPQLLNETIKIAKRCTFELSELSYQYPDEVVPKGFTASSYLRHLVEQGIKERFASGIKDEIRAIIEKELRLINEQRYEYFFLTIYDVVQFARAQKILYQGRGSAANSVVCYCLFITAVDPTQIDVLFERFISKERNEPPDIDVDFEHQRREEVIQYIYRKYGRDRAAIAATVHSFKLKGAIREVGKALGIGLTQLEFFIKNINRRDNTTPWHQQVSQLGLNPDAHLGAWFIQLVDEIRGFPRHLSQHVGGFIISKGKLAHLVPIENASMADRTVIQWDKNDIETLKLLKVDILALGMLSAIRKCFSLVEQHYDKTLSMAYIGGLGDDKQVYQMLQKADSVGVFQIESRAQMSMLPRLKPRCYYDLVIQIAIVRPGPIQGDMVHPYLRRREGKEAITYPSKAIEQVLSRTLGVPIFQEQVIKLAMVAAGFTGGEANELRRAMARWKKSGEMEIFRHKLVTGMQTRGYEVDFAERIFQQICGFGEYGFPESHSASFALLAYVSAWLKFYYPAAFYCAILNSLPMGFYSPSQLVQDARRHGIGVLPVDVNLSQYHHMLTPQKTTQSAKPQKEQEQQFAIRLGFRLVKGLSTVGIEQLIDSRPPNGFSSLIEVQKLKLNQRDLAALASAGAFACLSGNRYQTRWQMLDDEHELPLFYANSLSSDLLPHQPDAMDNLIEDHNALGLTLAKHPIVLLDEQGALPKYTKASALIDCRHQSLVTVIGIVTGKQSPGTASGVTFVTLEDDSGNINVVIWKGTALAQKRPFLQAKLLKVKGIVEREGDVIHVIAGKLTDLTDLIEGFSNKSRDFH